MPNLSRNDLNDLLRLQRQSFKESGGLIFIEGEKVIQEAAKAGYEIRNIFVGPDFLAQKEAVLKEMRIPATSIYVATAEAISRLSKLSTSPQIIALLKVPNTALADILPEKTIVCFDGIADPGNLGTMLRTADWFGFAAALLSPNCVNPYNDKCVRASMGSLFHQKIVLSQDWTADLQAIKKSGHLLVGTIIDNKNSQLPLDQHIALIMGSESHGISPESQAIVDSTYSIQGFGQAESLNVAVSFGIILHELTRNHVKP